MHMLASANMDDQGGEHMEICDWSTCHLTRLTHESQVHEDGNMVMMWHSMLEMWAHEPTHTCVFSNIKVNKLLTMLYEHVLGMPMTHVEQTSKKQINDTQKCDHITCD